MTTPSSKLRRQILKRAGVQPEPGTKRMLTVDQQPDLYPKTDKMKVLELRYHIKLETVIFTGSLSDVVQYFNGEVDRTTICKWRKYIRKALVDIKIQEIEGGN